MPTWKYCCIKYKLLKKDLMFQIVMCIFSLLTKTMHKFTFSWTLGDSDCISRALTMLNLSVFIKHLYFFFLIWIGYSYALPAFLLLNYLCFVSLLFRKLVLSFSVIPFFLQLYSLYLSQTEWIQVWYFYLYVFLFSQDYRIITHIEISILFRF